MNLVEQLLKADSKRADELNTGTYHSRKLAKILGAKTDSIEITFKEIKSRRLNDIISYQVDRKGNFDFGKSFDAKLMMCVEGLVDPDLTNKDLQNHFGVDNARSLCEKLFGAEINEISEAISALSGLNVGNDEEDMESEIKN